MTVRLAIYLAVVSLIYAVLAMIAPDTAQATLVGFVALLLVPVVVEDTRRAWRRRHDT